MDKQFIKRVRTAGTIAAGMIAAFAGSVSFAAPQQQQGDALTNGVLLYNGGSPPAATRPYTPVDCIILMEDNISWTFANGVEGDPLVNGSADRPFRSDLCADADGDGVGTLTVGGGSAVSKLPISAPTLQDVGLAGDQVVQRRNSRVSNVVVPALGDYIDGGGPGNNFPAPFVETGLGGVIPNVPAISPPPVPPVGPVFGPVSVASGQTVELNVPGVYGSLTIGPGTLRITAAGTYVFEWIKTSAGAVLSIEHEDVTIISMGGMSFGHPTTVNPANTPRFLLYMLAADGNPDPATQSNPVSSTTGLNAAFYFPGDRVLNACLNWVGNGTTIIRGNGTYIVRFQGQNFEKTTLNVTLKHPQDACGQQVACACISSVACDATGNVVAVGHDVTNFGVLGLVTPAAAAAVPLANPLPAVAASNSKEVKNPNNQVIVNPVAGTITVPVALFDNGLANGDYQLLHVCSLGSPPVTATQSLSTGVTIDNGKCVAPLVP